MCLRIIGIGLYQEETEVGIVRKTAMRLNPVIDTFSP